MFTLSRFCPSDLAGISLLPQGHVMVIHYYIPFTFGHLLFSLFVVDFPLFPPNSASHFLIRFIFVGQISPSGSISFLLRCHSARGAYQFSHARRKRANKYEKRMLCIGSKIGDGSVFHSTRVRTPECSATQLWFYNLHMHQTRAPLYRMNKKGHDFIKT